MTRLRSVLLALVLVVPSVSASAALDREAFTFTNYALDLRIEPQQQRLAIRGKVTVRNDSALPQRFAVLQISCSLTWRSIRAEGKPVQFLSQTYTSDIDHTGALSEAIVTLPHPVAPRDSTELELGYEGIVVRDATRLTRMGAPEDVARHSDWDQIARDFTTLRGIGYVAWYPVAMEAQNLSDGDAMFRALGKWKARHAASTMKISVTADTAATGDSFTLVCNGESAPISADSSGPAPCAFAPIGNAVPVLFFGPYDLTETEHARIFHQREHRAALETYAAAATESATLVTAWFGPPQRKAILVELADDAAAPYEAANLLALPLVRNDAKIAEELLAHQLTHATLPSPRLWIYEGTAHFAQALVLEQQSGREAAQTYLGLHRAAVLQAEQDGGQSLTDATDEPFYRSKGALVWWMLRDLVGENALRQTLHAYKPEQDENPKYFENLLQARSKRELGWFFQDWVYTDAGFPDFRIESVNTRKMTPESYVTAVTVENLGGAAAEVPVIVHSESGDFTEKIEVRGKTKAVIRVSTPGEPLEVRVNDGRVPETDLSNNVFKVKIP
jgi:hypothetical protein